MKCSFKSRACLVACALEAALAMAAPAAQKEPFATGANLGKLIRATGLDPTECYRVRDLNFVKDDIKFYFNDGYLIFSKPVNGERISAAFTADVEGGDAEVLLLPPYRGERQSMAKFTQSPNMDEHFSAALLVLSDGSAQALLDRITRENLGRKTPEMGPLLVDQWSPVLSNVMSSFELRLVQDLLTPQPARQGLVFATIAGRQLGNFDLLYNGRAREQILAGQLGERNGHPAYDIWTSFEARTSRTGASSAFVPPFTVERFQIDAALDGNLRIKATVHAAVKVSANPVRGLPFAISRGMEVTAARIDGAPAELLFRESERGRAVRYDENDPFLVVPAESLPAATVHQIEFDEEGSVISPAGNDVYYVGARSNWYPRSEGDFAIYDLTFRYPKHLTLVTPGDVTEDRVEGDWHITRRVTPVPIRMAGFNLGDYRKVVGASPGFRIEVYGNKGLETALQPKPDSTAPGSVAGVAATEAIARGSGRGRRLPPPTIQVTTPPDPLARLNTVASDVSSALEFFSGLFGPPILKTLTVSPIPAGFGQGFPGLVYLSTLAYLDPNDRPAASRVSSAQVFYSDLIEAHEVAHQWWGSLVLTAGDQDEWLSEALADYSALLYLEKKRGRKAMEDVLQDYRDSLVKKDAKGNSIESAGPITWGFRLESTGSNEAWRAITYDKGAWIFHMLRQRLGDAQFLKMLAELRRRFESRPLSMDGLRELVKQNLPPRMSPSKADAFFDNWVYASGIPTLKLRYTVKGVAPAVKISGQVDQSGVDDDFSIEVPVEVQFVKGAPQTIWVETSNNGATFSATLKQVPLKVSIPAGTRVLASKK
jgi:hypothetical protein